MVWVVWLLEELETAYEYVPAPPRSPLVMSLSPTGKIPVLVHDKSVITDSTAILTYLADRHGMFIAIAGTLVRARQDALTFRILDEIDSVLWTAARHSFILPKEMRVPEIKPSLKHEYAASLERLGALIKGTYLMDDEFTIADIILTHCCGWADNAGFPQAPESVRSYLARTRARPAYQRALAKE